MDNFETYFGADMLADPALKTSAANYDFKYIPAEEVEHIIKTVQRDRVKQKRNSLWTDIPRHTRGQTFSELLTNSYFEKKKSKSSKNKIIKTPKSTVKILTHQKLAENEKQSEESANSQRTTNAKSYIVPRVRIMTDSEIQKVVECAVKEVMSQQLTEQVGTLLHSNRDSIPDYCKKQMQLDLLSSENESDNDKPDDGLNANTENIISSSRNIQLRNISQRTPSPQSNILHNEGEIDLNTSINEEMESLNLGTDRNEDERSLNVANINDANDEHEDCFFEIAEKPEEDEDTKEGEIILPVELQSEKQQFKQQDEDKQNDNPKWIKIAKSNSIDNPKPHSTREGIMEQLNISLESSTNGTDNEEDLIEHSFKLNEEANLGRAKEIAVQLPGDKTIDVPKADAQNLELKSPHLSFHEKEELRKLLGIKENSEIYLDTFVEKESSDEDGEEEHEEYEEDRFNQINLLPVVHIRQPIANWITDDSSESEAENDTIDKGVKSTPQNDSKLKKVSQKLSQKATPISSGRKSTRNVQDYSLQKSNSVRESDRTIQIPSERRNKSLQNVKQSQNISAKEKSARNRDSTFTEQSKVSTPKRLHQQRPFTPSPSAPKISSPTTYAFGTSIKSSRNSKEISASKLNEINQEKMVIFSKITSYQEKIINGLEQMKMNLLDLTLPDSQGERKRLERHINEFSARFGRNYLYQLEQLINEIRNVPKDQFLSKHSNEFRTKICAIYGVLHQAVQSYLKQIKYFILDQSPKKLDVLIDLILDATKICIHKKIFDKRDELIAKLLKKCKDMLYFLDELHEQTRKVKVKTSKNKKLRNNKTRFQQQWEMKEPSKLSMYESNIPKRKSIQTKEKKLPKINKPQKIENDKKTIRKNISEVKVRSINDEHNIKDVEENPIKLPSKEKVSIKRSNISNRVDIDVNTQIENIGKDSATSLFSHHLPTPRTSQENINPYDFNIDSTNNNFINEDPSNLNEDDPELEMKRKLIETLQTITQQQVHEILGSLVSNLCLTQTDNASLPAAVDLETLLNRLNFDNAQMVNGIPITGNDTFNNNNKKGEQCGSTTNPINCNDNSTIDVERLEGGEHPVSNEQQLDLNQRKQRPQALWNRQLKNLSRTDVDGSATGESYDVDQHNTSPQTSVVELPTLAAAAAPPQNLLDTIEEEEKADGYPSGIGRTMLPKMSRDDNGANIPPSLHENIGGKKIQNLRYDRNIQFTFVSDENEIETGLDNNWNIELNLPLGNSSDQDNNDDYDDDDQNFFDANDEPIANKTEDEEENFPKSNIDKILEDRLEFIQQIADNPLYVNNFFSQPWKVVTKLTDKIVNELTRAADADLSFGEESYIEDFLRVELDL